MRFRKSTLFFFAGSALAGIALLLVSATVSVCPVGGPSAGEPGPSEPSETSSSGSNLSAGEPGPGSPSTAGASVPGPAPTGVGVGVGGRETSAETSGLGGVDVSETGTYVETGGSESRGAPSGGLVDVDVDVNVNGEAGR